jgi:hypothetical protein
MSDQTGNTVQWGAICTGTNTRYQARARREGHRRYQLIGKPTKSYRVAVMRMAKAFAEGGWKRADVIYWADYYDPEMMCELVHR